MICGKWHICKPYNLKHTKTPQKSNTSKILLICHIWQGTNEDWNNVYSSAFPWWQIYPWGGRSVKQYAEGSLVFLWMQRVKWVINIWAAFPSIYGFTLITDLEICLNIVMVYYTFTCYIKAYALRMLRWTNKQGNIWDSTSLVCNAMGGWPLQLDGESDLVEESIFVLLCTEKQQKGIDFRIQCSCLVKDSPNCCCHVTRHKAIFFPER